MNVIKNRLPQPLHAGGWSALRRVPVGVTVKPSRDFRIYGDSLPLFAPQFVCPSFMRWLAVSLAVILSPKFHVAILAYPNISPLTPRGLCAGRYGFPRLLTEMWHLQALPPLHPWASGRSRLVGLARLIHTASLPQQTQDGSIPCLPPSPSRQKTSGVPPASAGVWTASDHSHPKREDRSHPH